MKKRFKMASLSLGGDGGLGTAQSLKDWPFPKKFNITWRLSKLPIFVLGHAALKFYLSEFINYFVYSLRLLCVFQRITASADKELGQVAESCA